MRRHLVVTVGIIALIGGAVPAASATMAPTAGPAFCSVSLPQQNFLCAGSPGSLKEAWNARKHVAATEFLIGRLYDDANYATSDGYLNVYASGDCTSSGTNVDYSITDLDTWSNRVSSFETFGNCATRLWSGTNFGGTAYPSSSGYYIDSSYVGAAFNDKARSAQFS